MTRGPLAPNDRRHGTWGGYINYRCRCQPCREANRLKGRAWHRAHGVLPRAERIAANAAYAATLRPCGTMAAYHRHRRHGEDVCEACREAYNTYERALRRRRA